MTIGMTIKRKRELAGMKIWDLARTANVSKETIKKLESEEGRNPTLETFTRLANALGVRASTLLEECESADEEQKNEQ